MPNLIPLPSNAFSGAAVKFDMGPVDKMLLQNTFYKQQASQIALNKYFDKQATQLTGAGMDQNDGTDFLAMKDQWQQHSLANRKAIMNPSLDGGRAKMDNDRMFNETLQFAQKSKEKVANSQKAYQVLSDPSKAALITDHARDMLHHGTLPLNDPEYVPIDLSSVAFNPKPWGTNDEAALSHEASGYKGTSKDGSPVQDSKTGMQTVTTSTNFSKDDLTGMYGAGAQRYYSNPGFKVMIDAIPHNPMQFQDLNNLFKTHYGHDIQSGEDLSAAYTLSKNPNARSVDKTSPIPSYSPIAFDQKKTIAATNSANTEGREKRIIDYHNQNPAPGSPGATPQQDSEGYLQNIETRAKANPTTIQTTINGRNVDGKPTDLDPKIASVFAGTNAKKIPPDLITIDKKTGDYIGTWYKKDENGVPIKSPSGNTAISKSLPPQPLSRESVKQGLNEVFLPKGQAGKDLPKPSSTPSKTRPPLDSFIKK